MRRNSEGDGEAMATTGASPDDDDARVTRPDSSSHSRDRQLRIWHVTMRARYVGVVLLALSTALAPEPFSVGRVASVLGVLAIGLPYIAAFDVWLRRRDTLSPLMAFTDQAIAVAFMAAFEPAFGGLLLVLVGLNSTSAVAFGRVSASWSAMLGIVATGAIVGARELDVGWFVVFVATTAFVVHIVGAVSETERDLRRRHDELLDGIDAVVWEQLTRRPSTLYVSGKAEEMLGFPPLDWGAPGFWRSHVHPDDVDTAARAYRDAIRRGENRELEYRMVAADGRIVHVQDRLRVETDGNGRPVHVRGVMLDVTGAKEAEAQARQYLNLVDRISLALLVLRHDPTVDELVIAAVNPEATRAFGLELPAALGQPVQDVLPVISTTVRTGLLEVTHQGHAYHVDDLRSETPGRGRRVWSIYAFPLPNDSIGVSLLDVTERTMAAEVLRRQALHDTLTGLPNRTMLNERLAQAISSSDATGDPVSLLVLDLNQFKDVNDALGHGHGDKLLIELSRRLQRVLRDADTIARLGGDEFAVLLAPDADEEQSLKVAATIHESLEQPFQLGGIDVQTSASVGVTRYPDHGARADELVQRADVAMYQAKRGGLATVVYDPSTDQSSVRRLSLLGELRRAITESQLELHYQPSLTLASGTVRSAEALVRWRHPEHGMVPPIEFIELAEISGLIGDLTRWVLTEAVGQTRAWADAGLPVKVAINLSVRNLAEPDLVPWLEALLAREGVDPALVKLEVTESQLMDDPGVAIEVLAKVRSLGVATSIDDFGTGYSSLAYLKHLPVDELKIDRSFVAGMLGDASDEVIVRSTIELAHALGLEVVAEGVEDGPTLRRLSELGCDRAQGYFVSRPRTAADCTEWLRDAGALAAVVAELPSSNR